MNAVSDADNISRIAKWCTRNAVSVAVDDGRNRNSSDKQRPGIGKKTIP